MVPINFSYVYTFNILMQFYFQGELMSIDLHSHIPIHAPIFPPSCYPFSNQLLPTNSRNAMSSYPVSLPIVPSIDTQSNTMRNKVILGRD